MQAKILDNLFWNRSPSRRTDFMHEELPTGLWQAGPMGIGPELVEHWQHGSHKRQVSSRGSNENGLGLLMEIFLKSGCAGLSRKLGSLGMMALGNAKISERPAAPICVAA